MASSSGSKKRVRRENLVTLTPSLREKLLVWVDQHRPLKNVAMDLGCTERWLWNLRHKHGPLDKNLVRDLCKKAGVPFGPHRIADDDFTWLPAEEEHVKWAASLTPTLYQEAVNVDTKLNWLRWHPKGYWAIFHRGLVCGICECLSVKPEAMDRLCRGEISESQLVNREFFETPPWPAQHLLIQHLMILDRATNCIEPSPLAFNSVLTNLPLIIERCADYELPHATVYASPMHSHEQNPKYPSISERLMLRLGFTAVACETRPPFPFFSIKATVLVENLKQMREQIRSQWDAQISPPPQEGRR